MSNESKKNVSPSCACGKEDLYEVWLKNNKKDLSAVEDTSPAKKAFDDTCLVGNFKDTNQKKDN